MIQQYDNIAVSSLLLYIDHAILHKGMAYRNYSSQFYPIASNIQGQYAYSAPFRPFVNDTSISGANVMSGVYLNGNYVTIGQSGLKAINHYNGTIYFTGRLPANTIISGNYAIKEFNIKFTDKQDWQVMFENQYSQYNRVPQNVTGVSEGIETTPAIFVRYKGQHNDPYAFGGIDNKKVFLRAVVIADTAYQKVAVTSILINLHMTKLPLILDHNVPFDSLGNWTQSGVIYNWETTPKDYSFPTWITETKSIDVAQAGEYKDIQRSMAIVDFDISTILGDDF